MTAPQGEGVQSGLDVDALLRVPDPTFELIDPKTAPLGMLDDVRVNTRGRCLEADTMLGTVAVEMYWKTGDNPDGCETRGDFLLRSTLTLTLTQKSTQRLHNETPTRFCRTARFMKL